MISFSHIPGGPFVLADQATRFGGWPRDPGDARALVMAFPIEGGGESAAVVVSQDAEGVVHGEVGGCPAELAERAWAQALATLSLDVDGTGWARVGERDPVIGRLQASYDHIRPTLFHSPYEAAAGFVIGHRISIRQSRAIRARIAAEHGVAIEVGGRPFHAFPTPERLATLAGELPGVSAAKRERLQAIAAAAQTGALDRGRLRALPEDQALAELRELPGIGEFFAQGILQRGAGTTDGMTRDDLTGYAIAKAYGDPDPQRTSELIDAWRPFRMWTVVLLHMWVRNEVGLPPRRLPRAGGPTRSR